MAYAKINSVTSANIAKVCGRAKANISKVTNTSGASLASEIVNNYSVIFDGANDKLLMGNVTFDVGSYSVWIKTTITGGKIILQKDAAWYLYLTGGKIRVQHPMISGTLNSATIINDGAWHHLLVTCEGGSGTASTVTLYIDGSSDLVKAGPGTPNTYTASTIALSVAHSAVWGGYYLGGNLDEISFWTNVLTASEASTVYNSGVPIDLDVDGGGYTSSGTLQHWWRMGDGDTHPTIVDGEGGLNGTMTNMDAGDIVADVPS